MKTIQRLLSLVICLMLAQSLHAQDLSVARFYLADKDMSAIDNPVIDQNGNKCALIRVQTTQKGFVFDVGSLGVKKVDDTKVGEIWVYVPAGVKHIDVRHPQLGSINGYTFPVSIQSARTYKMELTGDRIDILVHHEIRKQGLQFVVAPANEHAIVKVKPQGASDYTLWGEVDINGTIDRQEDFGTYDYMVTAENFEPYYGRVTLSNNKETFVEKISLKPNFGFLEVTGDYGCNGADVYVDDRKVGTIPYKSGRMECRDDYRIAVTQGDLYKPYSLTFAIHKGETTRLVPQLESNFANTTLRVESGADIYIDGAFKGSGTWSGPLRAGQYTIACKKPNHRESSKVITVRPDFAETFELPAPIPITGGLYIRSTPSGASITIDGKDYGNTPHAVPEMLVGSHTVALTLKNYKTETRTVTVEEGKQAQVDVTLSDFAQMTIGSNPTGASLYLDGKAVGTTPFSKEMPSGDYKVRLLKSGYHDYESTIHLDSSNPSQTIAMQRQYIKPLGGYVQGTFLAGTTMGIGGAAGAYLYNVNIEAGYLLGLSSADVYWNNADGEAPREETLKPTILTARLGYGITVGTRLRITPQAGLNIVNVSGDISKSNAAAISLGVRAEYALGANFGISLTPEYAFAVVKSDTYKRLMDAGIKNFAGGIGVKIGIFVMF